MPRIRQYADKYAKNDFVGEIDRIIRCPELSEQSGLAYSTLRKRLLEPGDFRLWELKRVIKVAKPSIRIVLIMLGYSSKDIKEFKEAST